MSQEHPKRQILVFAHVPPPHHGQSVMVDLMLRGLARDPSFRIFHVDARLSEDLGDVGGIRVGKLGSLLVHCVRALLVRLRHGPMDLYYIPAPAKKSAIIRDWFAMAALRPWFSRTILHWHSMGLGAWACGAIDAGQSIRRVFPGFLDRPARYLTRLLLGGADCSLVLSESARGEVALLRPRRMSVVPNGIPDPCPDFAEHVLPLRRKRDDTSPYRCLYLAHCTGEKGLFDTVEAVGLANELLARRGSSPGIVLTVAGSFMNGEDQRRFQAMLEGIPESAVRHVGFAAGSEKIQLLRSHDCLVSFSRRETFGLNVVEALAFGMLPCLSPIAPYLENFSEAAIIAEDRTPAAYAKALSSCALAVPRPEIMRGLFLGSFSEGKFTQRITEALKED